MKSNNKYLHEISSNFGSSEESMSTNNKYLREIAKNTGSVDITGHHSDNYYLKRIALNTKDLDITELLQTIVELRGEVEDLEELLANDIHLFSCCRDVTQIGESLGLFAYCKHDGEVEGNTVHFYVVDNTPTPSSVTLTSDKSILSYLDNDKAVLIATLLDEDGNPVSNQDVTFKNGSTVLDTVSTDNNGEAEYEYTSQGTGDITFNIECGELSDTITIEDCYKYIENPLDGSGYNIPLPSSATISFEMSTTDYMQSRVYISLNNDVDYCHIGNSYSENGLKIYHGSILVDKIECSEITANETHILGASYDNGSWTYFADDEVVSTTNSLVPLTLDEIIISGGTMNNLKIKSL